VQLLSARVENPRLEPLAPPAVLTMEIPAGLYKQLYTVQQRIDEELETL